MTYQGIFMRQFVGNVPDGPRGGWADSPDIMPFGTSLAPDPTALTQQANYNKQYAQTITITQWNNVYMRGINASAGAQSANIYMYYTESDLMLWPSNWHGANDPNVNWGGNQQKTPQNYAPVSAQSQNQIVVTNPPMMWKPPPFTSSGPYNHYCLITWVDTGNNPPPNFSTMGGMTLDDLNNYIVAHPNISTRNTTDAVGTPASCMGGTRFSTGASPMSVQIYVAFPGFPKDGSFAVQVPGTDSSNTISLPQTPIPAHADGMTWLVNYPANFPTSLTVSYWQGATPPPSGSKIIAQAQIPQNSESIRMLRERFPGRRLPVVLMPSYNSQGLVGDFTPVIVVGSQSWTLPKS
ncbi:MAG: hypothetical protein M3328_17340 [Chloroflexota bacterium]|nr:hypothetical protein [Chloroflexota bacterium]